MLDIEVLASSIVEWLSIGMTCAGWECRRDNSRSGLLSELIAKCETRDLGSKMRCESGI